MDSIHPIPTPVHLTGRQLDRRIRHASAAELAVIADDLRSGRLVVSNFSPRQADLAVRFASVSYDRQADRAVERLGAERLWAAFARATAPAT